jgi:hypothetical protein
MRTLFSPSFIGFRFYLYTYWLEDDWLYSYTTCFLFGCDVIDVMGWEWEWE